MARIDYFAIEQAIKAQLEADATLAGVIVEIEQELSWFENDLVMIYLERRDTPAEIQTISAGQRTTFDLRFALWCWHFGLDAATSHERRDDLVGKVELALMRDRTLQATVDWFHIEGGEFLTAKDDSDGFASGAEIVIVARKAAIV